MSGIESRINFWSLMILSKYFFMQTSSAEPCSSNTMRGEAEEEGGRGYFYKKGFYDISRVSLREP